jgi:hypothetical protein
MWKLGVPRFARNMSSFPTWVAWLFFLLSIAACRSPGITVQIVNQTGDTMRTIEVLYPGGSYGIGHLVRGGSHAKWINPNADAKLLISFLDSSGQKHQLEPVEIKRGYAGGLAIVLLPNNQTKVEDHTQPGKSQ